MQLNQCAETVDKVRGLAIKIASVVTRCYYCDSDQNLLCTLSLWVGASGDHNILSPNSQTDKTETADVSQNHPMQAERAEV